MSTIIRGSDNFDTAPSGLGKVLQVVSSEYTGNYTTVNTTSFVDVPLSCSITPLKSNSKIVVMMFSQCHSINTGGRPSIQILRNGSAVLTQNEAFNGWSSILTIPVNFHFIDEPNTTSTVTYQVQGKTSDANYGWNFNDYQGASRSFLTLMEIGA